MMARQTIFALITVVLAVFITLLAAEIVLRFLPVREVLRTQEVSAAQPIHKFMPDENVRWSRDWNFSIVNSVRVNNDGFVNEQDYPAFDPRPQLAVIGDSYVESLMVPYAQTLHGRLATASEDNYIVYSYGASGAPLSQYLAYAKYAQERYGRGAMVFVIVGNDFDESLRARHPQPTFHQFVKGVDGGLVLAGPEGYKPRAWKSFVMKSALVRYVYLNLGVAGWGAKPEGAVAGNTAAAADEARLSDSRAAVDAFFALLPDYAQIPPAAILFVVDADRAAIYDRARAQPESYFAVMRTYFMAAARAQGYGVVDMADGFAAEYAKDGKRFEFPSDGHWNGDGHGAVYRAVRGSAPWLQLSEQLQ